MYRSAYILSASWFNYRSFDYTSPAVSSRRKEATAHGQNENGHNSWPGEALWFLEGEKKSGIYLLVLHFSDNYYNMLLKYNIN